MEESIKITSICGIALLSAWGGVYNEYGQSGAGHSVGLRFTKFQRIKKDHPYTETAAWADADKEIKMQHTMVISEEELNILNELLHAELAESRTEHRHTDDHDYRDRIRRRIQTIERLLQKVDVTMVSAGAMNPEGRFSAP